MKDFATLKAAVAQYESALESLKEKSTENELQQVIKARNEVGRLLRQEERGAAGIIEYLTDLDRDLEAERTRILSPENLGELAGWDNIVQPTLIETWWQGKQPVRKSWWEKLDWLWSGLNLVFLTISVSLITDAASRFLKGGFDTLSALTIAVPSVLTLLTSGALTKVGKDARQYLFTKWGIVPRRWEIATLGFSLSLLIGLVIFHQNYSFIATQFNQNGVTHYEANQLDSALSDYQRAIALKPNYAEAHYHLGLLYEDLQKLEKAQAQYQLAVENGSDSPTSLPLLKARNNLGRLYLLDEKYDQAIPPLLEVFNALDEELVADSEEYQKLNYTVLKNLGWAQLGAGNTVEATIRLKEAIQLNEDRASGYCLLAQVYEKQEQLELANKQWQKCRTLADISNPDEYRWLSIARERLLAPSKMP
ncbi:MAG: tetratricopeptide repeat protein [Cyanobacteria bacterium J06621_8]